jgi:hypothetical protein
MSLSRNQADLEDVLGDGSLLEKRFVLPGFAAGLVVFSPSVDASGDFSPAGL